MTGKSAGLYMVAEYIGYWSGTAFTAYIDNAGNFRFGSGSGSAKLEYSASAGALRGVNTSGTVTWYAQASNGKLYAGAGNVWLDNGGLGIAATAGKYTGGTLTWWYTFSGTDYRYLNIGTNVDLGAPVSSFIETYTGSPLYIDASGGIFLNGKEMMSFRTTAW